MILQQIYAGVPRVFLISQHWRIKIYHWKTQDERPVVTLVSSKIDKTDNNYINNLTIKIHYLNEQNHDIQCNRSWIGFFARSALTFVGQSKTGCSVRLFVRPDF